MRGGSLKFGRGMIFRSGFLKFGRGMKGGKNFDEILEHIAWLSLRMKGGK